MFATYLLSESTGYTSSVLEVEDYHLLNTCEIEHLNLCLKVMLL